MVKDGMAMENEVILSAIRTPIGAYGSALRDFPVYQPAALVLYDEAVQRPISNRLKWTMGS